MWQNKQLIYLTTMRVFYICCVEYLKCFKFKDIFNVHVCGVASTKYEVGLSISL